MNNQRSREKVVKKGKTHKETDKEKRKRWEMRHLQKSDVESENRNGVS